MASGTIKSNLKYREVTATTNADGRLEINNQAINVVVLSPNYHYCVVGCYNKSPSLIYVKDALNNTALSNTEVTLGLWEYK